MTSKEGAPAVALLNPFFWPEVRRGSERLIHDLSGELIALGARPRLITSHRGLPRRSVEEGLPITRHWRPPGTRLTARGFHPNLSHVPFTYLSLARGEDDVAHAFYPTDALAGLRWARKTGRPAIFSAMGVATSDTLASPGRRRAVVERVVGESDCVTALSRSAGESVRRWFGVEPRVIPPGVDLRAFSPGGERSEAPTVACASAVEDARKRIGLMIAAFERVRRQRPGARLLLTRPTDEGLARALTTGHPGVELVARERDVASMFREAWATGLTSRDEAFGLVLVESLACGTPVFGARDGGIPEIVDRPEIGRLFEGDDEADVARAILETLELAEAPGTAEACRARAEDFDNRTAAEAYLGLYRELVAG